VDQMGKERNYQEGRRTYPAYLTGGEYERQRRQTKEMVEGFLRYDPTVKIGETANFYIKIDRKQKTVLIKEKNIVVQCPFKLSIKQDEVENIIKLLTQGVEILRKHQSGIVD
jgi:hypothetical protein